MLMKSRRSTRYAAGLSTDLQSSHAHALMPEKSFSRVAWAGSLKLLPSIAPGPLPSGGVRPGSMIRSLGFEPRVGACWARTYEVAMLMTADETVLACA